MLCPKCRNKVTGQWCVFCGEKLNENPEEPQLDNPLNPDENLNSKNAYRDDIYNDERDSGDVTPIETVNPYDDYYAEPPKDYNKRSKIIAIVSISLSVLIVIGVLLYVFVFSKSDNNDSASGSGESSSVSDNKDSSRVKTLTAKGEGYMSSGNYTEAEKVYEELSDLTDDEEVNIIYEILKYYNKALDKLENGDYDLAEDAFKNIPDEYEDYEIKNDVEDLEDRIETAQNAKKAIEEIRDYIDDKDIEAARNAIDAIDTRDLPPTEKEEYEELVDELEELEKTESRSYDYPLSGYGRLGYSDAEAILENYCYYMVEAINNNDFSIVSPYILSSSSFYNTQKSLVVSCNEQGITECFDGLSLNRLTEVGSTKWKAQVTETETIYYEDGTEESKTFDWTYTIEYKNHYFYISAIE